MSSPTDNSPTDLKTIAILNELTERLAARGVTVKNLAVFVLPGDQIIGEVDGHIRVPGSPELIGGVIKLRNPKRLLRLQQASQHGLQINFMIGDLDFMDTGFIEIQANVAYYIHWMNAESQIALLNLYYEFLNMKSADKAGIALPDGAGIMRKR